MQTKANAELTIKFKQVHQIHFQYESVYSFFLDISQIVSFQILDTITTFAWENFRNIKLIPYRDICCVVFALFFKLFVGPTFANPLKSHLKYTFLVHSDSLVGFPIKSLAQWKTFKEKNEKVCCHASLSFCVVHVSRASNFPPFWRIAASVWRSLKRWTEDKLNEGPHQTFVRKSRSE